MIKSHSDQPGQIGRPLSIMDRPVCDDAEHWPGDDRPWCGRQGKTCNGCADREMEGKP